MEAERSDLQPPSPRREAWEDEDLGTGYPGSGVRDVDETQLNALVQDSGKHVFVWFYAPWCKQCKIVRPPFEAAALAASTAAAPAVAATALTEAATTAVAPATAATAMTAATTVAAAATAAAAAPGERWRRQLGESSLAFSTTLRTAFKELIVHHSVLTRGDGEGCRELAGPNDSKLDSKIKHQLC